MAKEERIEEVLEFWFANRDEDDELPCRQALWFEKSARVDRHIRKTFGRLVDQATEGALDSWAGTARGRLALIILLDQFNRNIHRDTPDMYRGDEKALALSFDGIDEGMDRTLSPFERCFFYMPAMHAEDVDAQLASVEVFQELAEEVSADFKEACQGFLKYAERHRDVVERFERFPHRNPILGRASTPEESAFLQQHDGF